MVYDCIVVGGGPAGAFFAYEMSKINPQKKVLIIERGKRVEKRKCPRDIMGKCVKCKPFCNITNGFSGAGAFSDGKLSLYNWEDDDIYVGGNLHKYIGVDKTKSLIDYTDKIYLKFGASKKIEGMERLSEISKIHKKAEEVGLELIKVPIRHLGTDKSQELYKKIEDYLEKSDIEFMFETEVTDLIIEKEAIKGVYYRQNEKNFKVYGKQVILAVGRVGANWLLKMCKKHDIITSPGIIDVGIRYELPDYIMEEINELLYEGKFVGKPSPFNDKVRTFCQNPSGFVSTEVYDDDITLVNGHALKDKKSQNTNLALLVSLKLLEVEDPMEYSRNIARNVRILSKGSVIVQRLGDIRAGKRTWAEDLEHNSVKPTLKSAVPGDLGLCMPYREFKDILGFIDMMSKVIPGFGEEDNLLYGPELKFYSNKVKLSSSFETSIRNLFAIGDGCGLTRGLMMASASGVQLARNLS